MSNFPLYTTLISNLPKKDLTVAQKNDLIKKIAELDTEAHDLIYALIKCYSLEHSGSLDSPESKPEENSAVPYNGEIIKEKINFSLLDFPVILRQLLYKFVTIHKKKLEEDRELQEMFTSAGE